LLDDSRSKGLCDDDDDDDDDEEEAEEVDDDGSLGVSSNIGQEPRHFTSSSAAKSSTVVL
jgi:hypothetical protein